VKALEEGEVPIGAVIVHSPPGESARIIARAHNQVEMLRDATAHAEMIAITQAAEHLENWRLQDCTLYVTIEPCMMCCGAMVLSRVRRVCYGSKDDKAGAVESIARLLEIPRLNHTIEIAAGIRREECSHILSEFFRTVRGEKRKS
jgi:tRNA(adenine34) deaminase